MPSNQIQEIQMHSRLYAMLPEAAIQWERRKIEAATKLPNAGSENGDYLKKHLQEFLGLMYNQRRPTSVENGVATIHIHDYLAPSLTFIDKCLGATDYADIAADISFARESDTVKAVLLDIDSGGGCAGGCVEVGKMISQLTLEKETAMFSSGLCCSAAYCIGVGAAQRYASPSAMVGSIGTILSFVDYENMLIAHGVTPHIIVSAGADLKASGNELLGPTKAEMEHLQATADEYAAQFISHVWDNNGRINAEQGFRGQAVSGRQAVEMGFIDAIASRDEVMAGLRAWASFVS